mmetsp:Transcript_9584/g.24525  ORF Transcript_9584/g.24525 Transcript_9584/m.24525 type:complete len:245 (+) Transcript_9584:56-790(+)
MVMLFSPTRLPMEWPPHLVFLLAPSFLECVWLRDVLRGVLRVGLHAVADVDQELCEPPLCDQVVFQAGGEFEVLELLREAVLERVARPRVVRQPQVAPNDVLEQPDGGLLSEQLHHTPQDGADGEEPRGGGAHVVEAHLVEENLLNDEGRHRLGQLASHLHRPQAERDYFRREQKVDDLRVVDLHERADDAQAREAEVLERPRPAHGVEKRVEKQGHVRLEEEPARLVVRRDALQQREGVANPI